MPLVEANGLRFHTQAMGERGSRIVMLHGMMVGSLTSWYFGVAPALAGEHRVLLYDMRGHGLSEKAPSGYGMSSMANDLAELLKDETEPVHLVGHSYGAVVALRFALDHPQAVGRVVVVEAPLPIVPENLLEIVKGTTPEEFFESLPESQRAMLQSARKRQGTVRNQVFNLALMTTMSHDLQAEPDLPDEELMTFDHPVLLCYGTKSPSTIAARERLARVLPHVQVETIEGGHFLPYDAAPALGKVIQDFLRD